MDIAASLAMLRYSIVSRRIATMILWSVDVMNKNREQSFLLRIQQFVGRNRALIFLLFVVFVIRIPSLYEPHRYADEEIYLTLGQGVRKGLVLYRDIHDNKPPFLYLTAALAHNLFWFRLILLLAQFLGVIFFWKLAEIFFKKRRWAVLFSTSFFALFSTLPFLEGNIANGENFMIVPPLLAIYLWYRNLSATSKEKQHWLYLVIGLMFAFGFLFKIPIIFDFLGLLIFWLLLAKPELGLVDRLKLLVSKRFWLVVIGFVGPIVLSVVYYALQGAFEPYFRSALLQNIGYLSTWQGEGNGILSNPLVWRGLIVFGIISAVFLLAKRLSFSVRFVIVWTAFSLYGALLSSRPYPHYLLEPLVPFSLLIVLVLVQRMLINRLAALAMVLVVMGAYFQNDFWRYETYAYYRNFAQFAMGSKNWEEYIDFWGIRQNYEIANYLKKHTSDSDRIFVWGTVPSIYALADRLPVGRYTVSYHIADFDAYEETITALVLTPAKYIVVIDDLDDFSQLNLLIEQDYIYEKGFDGVAIFRKIPDT